MRRSWSSRSIATGPGTSAIFARSESRITFPAGVTTGIWESSSRLLRNSGA